MIADTSIAPEGVRLLENEASLLMLPPYASEAEIVELAAEVDAILLRACVVSASVIRAAPMLKVVSRHGVGVDNVDVAECTRHGIAVAITEEANAQAVSEHAFACLPCSLAPSSSTRHAVTSSTNWRCMTPWTQGIWPGRRWTYSSRSRWHLINPEVLHDRSRVNWRNGQRR